MMALFGLLAVAVSAAALGGSSSDGTAVFELRGHFDSLDPALAYTSTSWQAEYATCVKLVNYPDQAGEPGQLPVPEAASGLPTVSKDGLKYTFVVPPNRFRFSPPSNERLTAASFVRAFQRTLAPSVDSAALAFTHVIAGADDYHAGLAASISGVTAVGPVLTIRLTQPSPDLLARLTMPFFCAVPSSAPPPAANAIVPSAGPYFVAAEDLAGTTVLKVNPNYSGTRPHAFDEIDYRANVPGSAVEADVLAGRADYAPDGIPLEDWGAIAAAHGPGTSDQQLFVNPTLGLRYLALNSSRPLFSNLEMRRAVNYALDRATLSADAGAYGLTPTDQILPPGMRGFSDADIYPLTGPDLTHAIALAAPYTPATAELYTCLTALCQAIAQHVQQELAPLGVTVDIHSFSGDEEIAREMTPGEPYDIAVGGWVADFEDPFDMLNVLVEGDSPNNFGHFDDPFWNGQLDAAAQLSGQARAQAYGDIDVGLMQTQAPMAPIGTIDSRDFFSARIGCQTYSTPFGMDIAALCLR